MPSPARVARAEPLMGLPSPEPVVLRNFLRSKDKNEAAARAASLEAAVSVGRALKWVGVSDTQGDRYRLNQLAQAIELLQLAIRGADEPGREPDAPPGKPL